MTQESKPTLSAAAVKLDDYIENWLAKVMRDCAGHEQQALIELVRSADLHAYFLNCFGAPDLTAPLMRQCTEIVRGIGPMLRKLLPELDSFGDGIPWVPSTNSTASWADHVLTKTGQLVHLRRLAYSERYGLVQCENQSETRISIHVLGHDVESLDRDDSGWLVRKKLADCSKHWTHVDLQIMGWARNRIDQYVKVHRKHFIEYDSDWELLELYQQYVQRLVIQSAEADAFPDDVIIGPRTFGEWKKIAISAAARACLHLSFATRLSALKQNRLNLRNLLTIFVRYEDLREVWRQQTGVHDEAGLDEIEDIFLFTEKHAEEYFLNHDYPLPYNIRVGKYFALLPQFGYLSNICTFLVAELRRKYRNDWDKAVNLREAKFQQDLCTLLPEKNYIRGRENVLIRRSVGDTETDIDAAYFEKSSNCLYLFQLKWLDVFAYGLRERQSKLTNLLKARKWIEQVSQWVTNTVREEILSRLGLKGLEVASDSFEVRLVVLTRFSARFSGSHEYDERAAWLSWPRLCRLMHENEGSVSPLAAAWLLAKEDGKAVERQSDSCNKYVFPGLQVDVYN